MISQSIAKTTELRKNPPYQNFIDSIYDCTKFSSIKFGEFSQNAIDCMDEKKIKKKFNTSQKNPENRV